MLRKIEAWVNRKNAHKRSLVKRADFLTTIGLLLIVIGSDYAVNGRYLISDMQLLGQRLFDPQLIGCFTLTIGVFAIIAAWINRPKITIAAFGLATAPFTLIICIYTLIALIDGVHAAGFRALLFFILLRFVWLSSVIIDLPDRKENHTCRTP